MLRLLLLLVLLAASPFFVLFVAIPLALLCYPNMFPSLFFMHWKISKDADYEDLEMMGVKSKGRNFYIETSASRLGTWHILPQELTDRFKQTNHQLTAEEMVDCVAQEKFPVIVYNHGNTCDRTMRHRVDLYNVLTDCGFHVFAFDYRGYGDSPGVPTEDGITRDARDVYDYVRAICGKNQLIVWGHSMGSGVSIRLVLELSLEGCTPHGLVLESAFNNLHDLVVHHPYALPFRFLPTTVIERYVVSHFRGNGLSMESDERIRHISCPILQFHAADDVIIPVKLARKLSEAGKAAGRDLTYVEFVATRRFGHKFVYQAEELPEEVKKFAWRCKAN